MTSETQLINTINTDHDDIINDAVLDYYGTTLATASNDCKIKLFDVRNGQQRRITELTGHNSQIWQIAWSHPSFGSILASCSFNGDTIIHKKDVNTGKWEIFHKEKMPSQTNSVCWAPVEFGLILAVACSNENIYILKYENNNWTKQTISEAHSLAVKCVSFAPSNSPASLFQSNSTTSQLRLVSGGDENQAKIWAYNNTKNEWKLEATLEGHSDWIQDVAWAPNIGLPEEQIATSSTDHSVIIWSRNYCDGNSNENNEEKNEDGEHNSSFDNQEETIEDGLKKRWKPTTLPAFSDTISHVSWSLTGGMLACSGGVDHVSLWKQDLSGQWRKINELTDDSQPKSSETGQGDGSRNLNQVEVG